MSWFFSLIFPLHSRSLSLFSRQQISIHDPSLLVSSSGMKTVTTAQAIADVILTFIRSLVCSVTGMRAICMHTYLLAVDISVQSIVYTRRYILFNRGNWGRGERIGIRESDWESEETMTEIKKATVERSHSYPCLRSQRIGVFFESWKK